MEGLIIAIVDVGPALGQGFTGAEQEIGLAELLGILELLTGVVTADQCFMEGVEQVSQSQYLDEFAAGFVFEKHHRPPLRLIVHSF
jgi:hypothetical protein